MPRWIPALRARGTQASATFRARRLPQPPASRRHDVVAGDGMSSLDRTPRLRDNVTAVGLKLRLIVVLMIPLTLVVGVYGFVRVAQERAELLEDNRRTLAMTMTAIQATIESALRDRKLTDIQRLVVDLVAKEDAIDRIRLFDRDLTPTIVSARVAVGNAVPVAAIRRVLRDGRPESLYERDGRSAALFYVAPIRGRDGSIDAVLELVQLTNTVEERVRASHWDIWIRLGILFASVAILTVIVLQREVLRPLAQLLHGIRSLGAGRPSPRLATVRRDEFGQVAAAFNEMAASLDAAQRRIAAETERTLDLEGELRQAENLAVAGKLATGFAHEVGTPLNIISGRAEFLLRTLADDDPRRADLAGIITQIDRIAAIIHSMLDVVRPRKPEPRPLHVAEVVGALLPLVEHAARRGAVEVSATVPHDLPPVFADPDQLQQVLLNLFVNALEATPPHGQITLTATPMTRRERRGVRLAVRDTGPGIAADLLDAVFKPFFTTKPRGQGTGLGLAICRDIVKEHDGDLEVESAPGDGATFVVWLPQADASPA
jgi:two-component system NtrC family sensor kinase